MTVETGSALSVCTNIPSTGNRTGLKFSMTQHQRGLLSSMLFIRLSATSAAK
ncbi:hypothetical protein SAMN05216522_12118 [Rosenbergiella nectarea]|uniref:Uncharacterized protein n=1 Tax=Rosenbergiella nectarea TaxID=988801 RepID=A0A1H9N2B0_9GAMM|nr:hypothetical protein SAMN05216522_12118 [Rosenbergiella nectarea]